MKATKRKESESNANISRRQKADNKRKDSPSLAFSRLNIDTLPNVEYQKYLKDILDPRD